MYYNFVIGESENIDNFHEIDIIVNTIGPIH